MEFTYEIIEVETIVGINKVIKRSDNAFIPIDEANSDYQRYLAWLENPEAEQSTPILPE
jgi:hypothetical protein